MGLDKGDVPVIKILVSCHARPCGTGIGALDYIQVGAALRDERFDVPYRDDEGEGISELNPLYCELTAQYWAWRNLDADYYGFCHYRRFFNFDPSVPADAPREVSSRRIDEGFAARYHLDEDSVRAAVEGYDIVALRSVDFNTWVASGHLTTVEQYASAPRLHPRDLALAFSIVKELTPEFSEDVDAYAAGSVSFVCNMFVMRRELFRAYCAWLFPILEEFMARGDMSDYSTYARRTPGHLAERLFNVFVIHTLRVAPETRLREVQGVFVEQPFDVPSTPCRLEAPLGVVPVVVPAQGACPDAVEVCVSSLLRHGGAGHAYDVCVVGAPDAGARRRLLALAEGRPNAVVRLFEPDDLGIPACEGPLDPASVALLAAHAMPQHRRLVMVASESVVLADVSELASADLSGALVAGAPDVEAIGRVNAPSGVVRAELAGLLPGVDLFALVSPGVVVVDAEAVRRELPPSALGALPPAAGGLVRLNALFAGRTALLDQAWDVPNDVGGRVEDAISYAPEALHRAYLAARDDPRVVRFEGEAHPWDAVGVDLAALFWREARLTPSYEQIAARAALRVPEVEARLLDLSGRVDALARAREEREADLARRCDALAAELDGLRRRLDGSDARIGSVEGRLGVVTLRYVVRNSLFPLGSARRRALDALLARLRG